MLEALGLAALLEAAGWEESIRAGNEARAATSRYAWLCAGAFIINRMTAITRISGCL